VPNRANPSKTNINRPSPVNGSWANVRGPSFGDFVTPNVLRVERGAPSLVRVPGDGCPAADAGVDAEAAGVDADVAVEPEPASTDGVALIGPD
jgi:hypothetical protein